MSSQDPITAGRVLAVVEKLEQYIDDSGFIPARRYYRGIIILGLISKALTVARAVCVLVDADFPSEAFGVSRTLIDIFFTIRYLSNDDTEARCEKFAKFYAKDHEGWAKIIQKFYPAMAISDSPFHEDSLEMAKEYKSAHQWTGLRDQTRQMALEKDSCEHTGSGEDLNCAFDYEVLYKWTSFYVHATVASLEGHFVEAGDAFRVRARIQIDKKRADGSLFNVLAYLHKSFISAFRALRQDAPEDILNEVFEMMRSSVKN